MLKRVFDFIFSIILTIILSPLLIIIAIAIKLDSQGRVIFSQRRMGQNRETFIVYKFRTMYEHAPENKATNNLDNRNNYITKVGYWLRVTSLDELPQLFNIIKGEMSIVGPRPVILAEKLLINKRKNAGIYQLKPGVTGYAQLNGRDHVSVDEKVELDKYYLDNHSLLMDLNIILKTGIRVLKREDILEHHENINDDYIEENNLFRVIYVNFLNDKKSIKYPLGGLLVFIIFMIGFFFLRGNYLINLNLLVGLAFIYLVGLIDDYKDLNAKLKLFLQLVVISYLVLYGIRVTYITNPLEGFIYFEDLSIPVTVIWIFMMVNLMNLLNVLKGMASGIAIITSIFIIMIAWDLGRMFTVFFAGILLIGLIITKLLDKKYGNLELGNSGSMFIGALLAIISIVGAVKSITFISLFLPVILLGVPIINGFIGLYQVVFKSKLQLNQLRSKMLHHVLLERGISEEESRQIFYIITFVFGLVAFLLTKITTAQSLMIIILIVLFLLVYFRELRQNAAKRSKLINVKLLKDIQLNLYQIRDKLQYKLANGELTTVREEISRLETILTKKIPTYLNGIDDLDYNFNEDEPISYQLAEILNYIEQVFDYYYSDFDNLNYVLRNHEDELRETTEKLDQIYMKLK